MLEWSPPSDWELPKEDHELSIRVGVLGGIIYFYLHQIGFFGREPRSSIGLERHRGKNASPINLLLWMGHDSSKSSGIRTGITADPRHFIFPLAPHNCPASWGAGTLRYGICGIEGVRLDRVVASDRGTKDSVVQPSPRGLAGSSLWRRLLFPRTGPFFSFPLEELLVPSQET